MVSKQDRESIHKRWPSTQFNNSVGQPPEGLAFSKPPGLPQASRCWHPFSPFSLCHPSATPCESCLRPFPGGLPGIVDSLLIVLNLWAQLRSICSSGITCSSLWTLYRPIHPELCACTDVSDPDTERVWAEGLSLWSWLHLLIHLH